VRVSHEQESQSTRVDDHQLAAFRAAIERRRDEHTAAECPSIQRLRQRIAEARQP
jgi:hypothetical protein